MLGAIVTKYENMRLYNKQLLIDDKPVRLSQMEYMLLKYMMKNPDRTLSREDIMMNVWQGMIISDRSHDVLICKIKKKLPDEYKDIIKSSDTMDYHGYSFGSKPDNFTKMEKKILHILKNSKEAVSLYSILKLTHYHNDDTDNQLTECRIRSLRVIMNTLRKKLKNDEIWTVKYYGYQWNTK